MKLNLGCDVDKIKGFKGIDHRREIEPDYIDDVFNLSHFRDSTIEEIVAFHILEHACFDRTIDILKSWYNLLIDGGKLWVAVPNFQNVLNKYLSEWKDGKITWEFFCSRIFGNAKVAHQMYGEGMVSDVRGIHKYELAFHRAVFTKSMLCECFEKVGFTMVKEQKKCPYRKLSYKEICVLGVK